MKAAKENKNILVIARTDALTLGSMAETLKRCLEYKKMGVDAVFMTGLNNLKQLKVIKNNIKGIPLMLNITQNVKFNLKDVIKNKFKLALFSQQILDGYIDSTKQTLDFIKRNKIPKFKNKAKDTLGIIKLR